MITDAELERDIDIFTFLLLVSGKNDFGDPYCRRAGASLVEPQGNLTPLLTLSPDFVPAFLS